MNSLDEDLNDMSTKINPTRLFSDKKLHRIDDCTIKKRQTRNYNKTFSDENSISNIYILNVTYKPQIYIYITKTLAVVY